MFGRMEVEPDDIRDLGRKRRIATHLVGAGEVWLEPVGAQDIGDTAAGPPDRLAQQASRPPAASGRRRGQRELHNLLDRVGRNGMVPPARLRTIPHDVHALAQEPAPDARYRFGGQVEPRRDVHATDTRGAQENHPRAANDARGCRRAADDGFQQLLLLASGSNVVRVGHVTH